MQVFVGQPARLGDRAPVTPRRTRRSAGSAPTDGIPAFVHAPYLVNFGSPTEATLPASVGAVAHALGRAAAIGARGVVVHAGSAVAGAHREEALAQLREHLLPVLDALDRRRPRAAGRADGRRRAGARRDRAGPRRLVRRSSTTTRCSGVCLDTCHAFAAGPRPRRPRRDEEDPRRPGQDGRPRAARAGARQRQQGPARLDRATGTRRSARATSARTRSPSCSATRRPAASRCVVETPGDAASHRQDVDVLRGLQGRLGPVGAS